MTRILITGFGPFPGVPYNPTGPLALRLARLRHPAGVERRAHVFRTSYSAVDAELPKAIAAFKPDALLMFGVATGRREICIETRAQNALASTPDVAGARAARMRIAAGASARMMPFPPQPVLLAARAAKLPVRLSRDAGRYLCNYLCWRAGDAVLRDGGPRLAVFVHVPAIRRGPARPRKRNQPSLEDLTHAGSRILTALVAAAKPR